jgi:ABC-type phosphate/phosphonate transport system ATPase subunit
MTLSGVNLTFKEGSFVCILGKAASGKTSLLRSINGDLISVSEKDMEMLGGSKATKTSAEMFAL